MEDFLSILDREINKASDEAEEARIRFNTLQSVRAKYVESQKANGHGLTVPSTSVQELVSMNPDTFSHDDGNKTQLVVDAILSHEREGAKAGRIFADIIAKGVTINKNYVYSILNRLKKSGRIQSRRGKYFPTLSALAPSASTAKSSAP